MKNVLFGLGLVSFAWLAGCSAFNDASSTTGEPLVRCNTNADCMTGLECEIEHSATSGVCAVHGVKGAGGSANEHGTGGADDRDGAERAAGGTDDHGTDDHGTDDHGTDDHGTDDTGHGTDGTEHGAGGAEDHDRDGGAGDRGADSGSGGSVSASPCATNADCATGFECEIEAEHGVMIGTCRAHGGGKGK